MYSCHHRRIHLFHYILNRELSELYLSNIIRAFAISLIGLFIPLYFLKLGYDISFVLLFYFGIYLLYSLFLPFFGILVKKIGVKHSMLISLPFLLLTYISLYYFEKNFNLIYLAILSNVICIGLYWVAFHLDFSKYSKDRYRGRELGFLNIANTGVMAAAPFLGGIILNYLNYRTLFLIVIFLLICSSYPLFLSREIYEKREFTLKGFFTHSFEKTKIPEFLAFSGEGVGSVIEGLLWPVFIFQLVKNYAILGGITSLAIFLTIAFTYFWGILTDKEANNRLIKTGVLTNFFSWPLKMTIISPFTAFLVDLYSKLTNSAIALPFNALVYKKAKKAPHMLGYVVFKEFAFNFPRALVFFLLYFIFTKSVILGFISAFSIAAIFSLFILFLKD